MAIDLYTSNFDKDGDHPDAISIAGRAPVWYIYNNYKEYTVIQNGKIVRPLAPSWSIYDEYIKTGDSDLYTRRFKQERLLILDPQKVYQDLLDSTGRKPPILLCYEKEKDDDDNDEFCHRHLVAKWLQEKLGLRVAELSKER